MSLLRQPRFLRLFIVQFLGAFNDNLFKNALVILITYRIMVDSDAGLTVALAGGLFILPFFLFSAWAGHLADRWDKVWLTQKIKLAEILIMLLASMALISGEISLLLSALFLLGVQSAFFGPIKYSILPEHVTSEQLMSANAWFSSSTFVAILLGTVAGGIIILMNQGITILSLLMLVLALIGYLASRALPYRFAQQQDAPKIGYHWWRLNRAVFNNFHDGRGFIVVAISLFWFIGASLLSQFPVWVKDYLYADEQVAVMFMALFALGFALGAIVINSHLKGRTLLRYQPFLLLLMALALADALWATSYVPVSNPLLQWDEFLSQWPGNRVLFDLTLVAFLGGAYTVPLYTQLQRQVVAEQRAKAFALNNVLNALFMVVSAVLIMLGYAFGLDWLQIGWLGVAVIILFIFFEMSWRKKVTLKTEY